MARNSTGWTIGVLVEHGPAPYHFEEAGSKSYFVRIRTQETEEGARRFRQTADQSARPIDGRMERPQPSRHDQGVQVLWGADLKRAIEQSKSHVQIGQTVAARIVSTQALESRTASPEFKSYRNIWEIETPRYLEQRQKFARQVNESYRGASQQGINDPEGLALYLIHDGAERLAKVRYRNAEDQEKFLNRLRDVLKIPNEREAVIKAIAERLKLRGPSQTPQPEPQVRE